VGVSSGVRSEVAGAAGPVLAFSIVLAICTSVLFSLAPALQATGARVAGGLKAGVQNIARGNNRFRSALVVVQITLGLLLLVGAESSAAGFLQFVHRGPGFRPDHLFTFNVGLSEQADFGDRLLARLKSIPGVESAAMGRPSRCRATKRGLRSISKAGRRQLPTGYAQTRRSSPGVLPRHGNPACKGH
jgi:hypothetical protein